MKLVFLSGTIAGHRYQVDKTVTIGRDVSNNIVIPDSSVSLVHCQIILDANGASVKDLGSTNGVHVNGERVVALSLRDGDSLVIGTNKARIELPEESGPATVVTRRDMPQATSFQQSGGGEEPVAGHADLSGNIFGSVTYYLKRKIATGGMGSIYEAEQFGADGFIKKVAIKTILPEFATKESFVSSFIGEAKLVANLVHQNIVQIHHLGRHEDGYYIAMEYIEGRNLTSFINMHRAVGRQVPVDLATFIVSRVCRGLEYAHSKCDNHGNALGLVHRDVSPNNIMITAEGEVKLTDFGVAKAARFMEDSDDYLVGSVEYMSPEQADCLPVDGRSDLFSLGLVYYELLTGVRVFQCVNDDIDETVERVKLAKYPDPRDYRRDLPDGVMAILGKCLRKEPADRYSGAGEMGYALEHEMYSRGYGPTIVSLAGYIRDICK